MSSNVYLHRSLASDTLLGHVDDDGEVYEHRFGPDKEIGHAHLASGKIYSAKLGPDSKEGYVDLKSGKVYHSKAGFDELVGTVYADGRMTLEKSLAKDDYIGKINSPASLAHSGAALLLLVLPALEEEESD